MSIADRMIEIQKEVMQLEKAGVKRVEIQTIIDEMNKDTEVATDAEMMADKNWVKGWNEAVKHYRAKLRELLK